MVGRSSHRLHQSEHVLRDSEAPELRLPQGANGPPQQERDPANSNEPLPLLCRASSRRITRTGGELRRRPPSRNRTKSFVRFTPLAADCPLASKRGTFKGSSNGRLHVSVCTDD